MPVKPSMAAHFSSESVEHYTPDHVWQAAEQAFGGRIYLDPASPSVPLVEQPVPALIHFTREDDGLARPWNGDTYCNPPYGEYAENADLWEACFITAEGDKKLARRLYQDRGGIFKSVADWVHKAISEHRANPERNRVILLLPNRPGSEWWLRLARYPVCNVKGRLRFVQPGGVKPKEVAPFPSAIFFLGLPVQTVTAAFGHIGEIRPGAYNWENYSV